MSFRLTTSQITVKEGKIYRVFMNSLGKLEEIVTHVKRIVKDNISMVLSIMFCFP